jgi:glycosyltransferase involved in cell wall biosynthesis
MERLRPKVSILMPSLNVAEYIRECLDSVVNQTLKDIEIICIDADSTDGTLEILREYEKQDRRIHIIVSDKKSYGYQMNLGLDAANGEYIGIVEMDDWIEPDMFENLWKAASGHNVDIVKSNYYWYYTKPEVINKPFENLSKCPYEKTFSPQDVLQPLATAPSIWSGIYRHTLIKDNKIRFNETPGASYQDTSFHFMVFTVAKTAFFLNKYYLHYRRDNEASSVNTGGKVYCLVDEMHYYENFLETHPEAKASHIKQFMALKYDKYRWNYARIAPQFQWDFLTLVRREFLAHKEEGLLEENRFDADAWTNINEIINSPVQYFKNTCKKYSTRPVGEKLPPAEMLKQSLVECPDVSIIIPSYNNQDCIHRSLESAQRQTLKNIEIICVDDGSDDETVRIIMESAITDSRITVLRQVNQGQSSARNAGLQVAKGRYIQFLDSDDRLKEDAAATLVAFADKKELEILYFEGISIYEPWELKEKYPYYIDAYEYETYQQKVLTGKEYFCSAREDGKYRVDIGMALFNRQFLDVNHIRFIDGIIHEDHAFTFFTLLTAERVWHITEKLYFHYIRSNSTVIVPKTIFHVYGYLTSYQVMFQIIQSLTYDESLFINAAKELKSVCSLLRSAYNVVKDKKTCRAKLTDTELLLLDQIIKPVQNRNNTPKGNEAKELFKLRNELLKLRNSNSYKIGRLVTWPVRKIKGFINSFKIKSN